MFDFGNPEDTAELFQKAAFLGGGPVLPDCHWEEMQEQDLRNAFTYLYRSVRQAHEEGASDEVMEILTNEYDKVFTALAEASDRFKAKVLNGGHQPVLGTTREQVDKYKGIVASCSSES